MKLRAEDTAALFIDFQNVWFLPSMTTKQSWKNSNLAKGLQEFGVPVAVTQQYTKGLGDTVPAVKEAFADFNYMEKTSFPAVNVKNLLLGQKHWARKTSSFAV